MTSAGRTPACSRPTCGSKVTFQISPALGSSLAPKDLLQFRFGVIRFFVLETVHRPALIEADLFLILLPGNRIGAQSCYRGFYLSPELLLLILVHCIPDHLPNWTVLFACQIPQLGGNALIDANRGGHAHVLSRMTLTGILVVCHAFVNEYIYGIVYRVVVSKDGCRHKQT